MTRVYIGRESVRYIAGWVPSYDLHEYLSSINAKYEFGYILGNAVSYRSGKIAPPSEGFVILAGPDDYVICHPYLDFEDQDTAMLFKLSWNS